MAPRRRQQVRVLSKRERRDFQPVSRPPARRRTGARMKVRARLRCRGKCASADLRHGHRPTDWRLARKVAPSERQSHGSPTMLSDRRKLSSRFAHRLHRRRRQSSIVRLDLLGPFAVTVTARSACLRPKENWPLGCCGASLSNGSGGVPRCGVKSGAPGAASYGNHVAIRTRKRQRRTWCEQKRAATVSAFLRNCEAMADMASYDVGKTRRQSNAEPLRHVIGRPEQNDPSGQNA